MSDDTETMKHLQTIAAAIFARYGVDFASARRAGGWTNITWLAGGLALRLSTRPGADKIRREVRLAVLLPPEVGYPEVVETGVTDGYGVPGGYEWSLAREIQARPLGEVWPELDWQARAAALNELWLKARAVHSVDLAAAAGLVGERAWFNNTDPALAAATLNRLAAEGLFSAPQAAVLAGILERFWLALAGGERVLTHGDLTLDNALWHAGSVVSLMDFEFALIAPAEIDLNELVKWAYAPLEDNRPAEDRERAHQVVALAAQPLLARPGGWERLCGYALLLELWLLDTWLQHPEGEGPLETWAPYRMLLSLADGQFGYLAPLRARINA